MVSSLTSRQLIAACFSLPLLSGSHACRACNIQNLVMRRPYHGMLILNLGLEGRSLEIDLNERRWNTAPVVALDVTNPEAVAWFVYRLRNLQAETGIDGFKFDAGESSQDCY